MVVSKEICNRKRHGPQNVSSTEASIEFYALSSRHRKHVAGSLSRVAKADEHDQPFGYRGQFRISIRVSTLRHFRDKKPLSHQTSPAIPAFPSRLSALVVKKY
jgi:hypothetical protein